MDSDVLLRFAQRMRDLMLCARTEVAREQLRIWAEEFEARAAALEIPQPGNRDPESTRDCHSR